MLSFGLVCVDALALSALLRVWDCLEATLLSDDILLHNIKEWGLYLHDIWGFHRPGDVSNLVSWREIERVPGNLCPVTEYECLQRQILTDLCCLVLCTVYAICLCADRCPMGLASE